MAWDGGMRTGARVVWGVEFSDRIGSVGSAFSFCETGDRLPKGGKCKQWGNAREKGWDGWGWKCWGFEMLRCGVHLH